MLPSADETISLIPRGLNLPLIKSSKVYCCAAAVPSPTINGIIKKSRFIRLFCFYHKVTKIGVLFPLFFVFSAKICDTSAGQPYRHLGWRVAHETHMNTFNNIQKMESNEKKITELPKNAYRELQPGEEYKPVLPADRPVAEATPWAIGMGLLMAVIFSAAAAYSGLKIGQVFEAAIPISIIAVGASAAFRKKNALGQNVIIQSIGASSGVIVAGAVFTIPGLYILQAKYPEIQINFWQIFFSSLLGGCLGILFLIPFRKYFVKDMHGKLPFPEATATTEILMTGEKGGTRRNCSSRAGSLAGYSTSVSPPSACGVR